MIVDAVETLRRSPLFELLSPAELGALAELCRPRDFAAGETIFEAGSPAVSLFVLGAGEVEVLHPTPAGDKVLAALAAPDSFGEMGLVDREARSAAVRARTACETLELTAEAFTAFRKRSRDGFTFVVINIARILSHRLRDTSDRLARLA
ncbi:MAG: cyclic nucleotide-binding domain-containing protein [Anaeromyxobacter sp.]